MPEHELILTSLQARMYHPDMAPRCRASKQDASKQDEMGKYASSFASLGGKARARKLTPEQRREIARKAIQARWARAKAERKGHEGSS